MCNTDTLNPTSLHFMVTLKTCHVAERRFVINTRRLSFCFWSIKWSTPRGGQVREWQQCWAEKPCWSPGESEKPSQWDSQYNNCGFWTASKPFTSHWLNSEWLLICNAVFLIVSLLVMLISCVITTPNCWLYYHYYSDTVLFHTFYYTEEKTRMMTQLHVVFAEWDANKTGSLVLGHSANAVTPVSTRYKSKLCR